MFLVSTCQNLNGCFGCEDIHNRNREVQGHSEYMLTTRALCQIPSQSAWLPAQGQPLDASSTGLQSACTNGAEYGSCSQFPILFCEKAAYSCLLTDYLAMAETWFRFFIKQMIQHSSYNSEPKYIWYEMGFFTHWSKGGDRYVLCFDVPPALQDGVIDALTSLQKECIVPNAYAFHTLIAVEVVKLYDESIWSIRNVVRQVETARYSVYAFL